MAIYHCTAKAVSRSTGRSAPGAAAYRAGDVLTDERTGEVFDYTRKAGVLSADIVLPESAPEWARDRNKLWNAAEAAERRKDACVAREYEVALPYELTHEQRRELALSFAKELAERHGVAVDVCLHEPGRDGDEKNFHAHILTTTRVMGPDGLAGKAEIEKAGRNRTADLKETRALWAQLCNEALERAGHSVRVDHRSYAAQQIDLTPTKHIGVSAVAMDRKGLNPERAEIHAETRAENAARIEENPALILDKITRTQAVFDRRDIARELHRYIDDPQQFQGLMLRLENSPELVQLAPEQREGRQTIPARLTTREMIEAERAMITSAEALAGTKGHGVNVARLGRIIGRYETLSDEQRAAVEAVTGDSGLSVVVGDAGTGKSFAMRVAKEAWEAEGYRVRGCALAGKAADELQAGSGIESRTIHSLEASWNRGRDMLTERDVLVIDEAGMVGSRQLGRVLTAAEKAGAKVVMLGDDKQLAAIEAGAGFRVISEHIGAAELTEIRRQREGWAREASKEFARGDVRAALDAYNERGHVRIVEDREAARKAIVADWLADRQRDGTSAIMAHANRDVLAMNAEVREARKMAGELGAGVEIETARGRREFADGDRLVFLRNDSELGVKNGTLGTVERVAGDRLAVRLDDGREVAFSAEQYAHVDHGYALTIHKEQGVTVDRAYVLATGGMDRSLAYVGMTRHREAATLYAGADDFTDRRVGRLVEHGAAPYENNPENSESYFVTLETDSGKRHTIWGVDLARAVAESGAELGDRIGLEHVGSETVRLPDGTTAERNSWRVRDGAELAYEKLAGQLARERPKESTLDFAETAYQFAEARGFDGEGVVRRWIERGREKLTELGERAEKAITRVLERAGIRRDVPAIGSATAEQIEALRDGPQRPQERPQGFVPTDRHRDMAELVGGPETGAQPPQQPTGRQGQVLDRLRAELTEAQKSGDELRAKMAAGRLDKAERLAAAGERLDLHSEAIRRAGFDALRGDQQAAPVAPAERQQPAGYLDKLRDELAAAQQASDEAGAVAAAGKVQKAEELDRAGKPLTHHVSEIEKAGTAALREWAAKQRSNAAPAATMTQEEAAALERIRNARNREKQRDRDRGQELD